MAIDVELLEVLACPADGHTPLEVGTADDPDAAVLRCGECGRVYPITDGIPVLLLEQDASSD